jgi:hypothetical protein
MSSTTPGPHTGRSFFLSTLFRSVLSYRSRRLERILEQNAEWAAQARNAPTIREQMERGER